MYHIYIVKSKNYKYQDMDIAVFRWTCIVKSMARSDSGLWNSAYITKKVCDYVQVALNSTRPCAGKYCRKVRPKKKRCLVPITLPYLVFVPYPKVFFANPTEK